MTNLPICPQSTHMLVVEGLVKEFKKGPRIGPISFRINRGEIFALVGPNGAGKTTTIRVLLGIYRPSTGDIYLCGKKIRSLQGVASYVPEESAVYPRLTGYEHLYFYALLYTNNRTHAKRLADRAAEYTGLSARDLRRKVQEYSKGMKRRLLLGIALALETPILVLDEPTAGLDVHSAVHIRKLIKGEAEKGKTIILSSHNMFEVERLADTVAFINRGRIVALGTPRELLEKYNAHDLEEAFVKATSR